MYNRILVPLDGSELAEQILPQVTSLASSTGAEVVLLRVPDLPVNDYLMTAPGWSARLREQADDETREYLMSLGKKLRAQGLRVQTQIVYEGTVYSAILNTAREFDVDLIAMSTHGRSGLARLVMGSVADDVVRHAELPVLLVRPQPVSSTMPSRRDTAETEHPAN